MRELARAYTPSRGQARSPPAQASLSFDLTVAITGRHGSLYDVSSPPVPPEQPAETAVEP